MAANYSLAGGRAHSLTSPPVPRKERAGDIRIVSWNVGLLALPTTVTSCGGSLAKLLDALGCDVLCLQEVKTARPDLQEHVVLAPGFTSFFSCSLRRSGYAGVATIVRDGLRVHAVQHGLTGVLDAGGAAGGGRRAAPAGPADDTDEDGEGGAGARGRAPAAEKWGARASTGARSDKARAAAPVALRDLDGEGRALVTDLGDVVVINVYAPAGAASPARTAFKWQWHAALQRCAHALLAQGRRVIVCGDVNVSHRRIDHCDPGAWEKLTGAPFASSMFRQWMDGFVAPLRGDDKSEGGGTGSAAGDGGGASLSWEAAVSGAADGGGGSGGGGGGPPPGACPLHWAEPSDGAHVPPHRRHLVDAFRAFFPTRRDAFTHWSQQTGSRVTNQGARW